MTYEDPGPEIRRRMEEWRAAQERWRHFLESTNPGPTAERLGRALWSAAAVTRHTAGDFLQLALDVRNRYPRARLTPAPGGNLAIHEGGVYRGYVDIRAGSVELGPLPR